MNILNGNEKDSESKIPRFFIAQHRYSCLCDKKHIEACLSIAKELREYFTEDAIETMGKDMKKHLLYIATDSSEVTGFMVIQHKNKYCAEILWMAVKKKYHNQNVGSALINHTAKELKSQDVRLLQVKTLSDNKYPPYEKTRRFYEKNAFILLETIESYPKWDPGNPCAIYVKIL
ncbi:MAG: GNAT family N-acetyltransferase [Thermoplasmatales archaeon]|nr:GNAT family N-acetyltransferase [Candidatus Methanoperedenaceae archaeon]MCG2827131.1 GNAT family N-acetyltransferase [Thermoplasmatales archaeon]